MLCYILIDVSLFVRHNKEKEQNEFWIGKSSVCVKHLFYLFEIDIDIM